MTDRAAFQPDEHTDLTLASDGISRYGAYLTQHRHVFAPCGTDDPPTEDVVEFALSAWQVAGPPIMAPGYVSWHPRIQATTAHWDDEHRAALAIDIAVLAPASITTALTSPWREWDHTGWPESWCAPGNNDRLALLTTLTVRVPLHPHRLPDPCYRRGIPCIDTAKRAVLMLCTVLNTELDSMLAALDTPDRHLTPSTRPP